MNRNEALDYLVSELKEWPKGNARELPVIDGWTRIQTLYDPIYVIDDDVTITISEKDWLAHKQTLEQNYQHEHPNMVNHPSHYTQGDIECIDAIRAATVGKTGIEAVNVGNVIKYLWRYESKNGLGDVKKAKWYLEHLIKELSK